MKSTQLSFNKSMFKQTVVHLHHEILSAIKRSKLLIHATTWVEFKGIMLSEKNPISKGHILYDFNYITY